MEGECPLNSYDFITEVHKSIALGLGYMPSFYVQGTMGTYGMLDPSVLGLNTSFTWESMQGLPVLYDTHICNVDQQFLTDSSQFANVSNALYLQLTGGNLRYHGTHGNLWGGGEQPVLYAGTYNLARTARLLSTNYVDTENAPGVPIAYYGNVLRYPAPIILGILKDLGWNIHTAPLIANPANFSASVLLNNVFLEWAPIETPYTYSTQVYRNGELLANVWESSFVDEGLATQVYEYQIRHQYNFGLSEYSEILTVEVPISVSDPEAIPVAGIKLNIFPNPIREEAQIKIFSPQASLLKLSLYDIRGRKCQDIFSGTLAKGTSSIDLQLGYHYPAGIYFINAHDGKHSTNSKILVLP